jgi:hypothetical protein
VLPLHSTIYPPGMAWRRMGRAVPVLASAGGAAAALWSSQHSASVASAAAAAERPSRLRDESFPLTSHYHGKAKVRVLKVRRPAAGQSPGRHEISEFTVQTRLFSSEYSRVFTEEDNSGLVATDTQKNTVYVVAKRTACETPEQFGIDVAEHLLREYPILSKVEVETTQVRVPPPPRARRGRLLTPNTATRPTPKPNRSPSPTPRARAPARPLHQAPWSRVVTGSGEHEHGFVRGSNERAVASVRVQRGGVPEVQSSIEEMTILKTTQSGFEGCAREGWGVGRRGGEGDSRLWSCGAALHQRYLPHHLCSCKKAGLAGCNPGITKTNTPCYRSAVRGALRRSSPPTGRTFDRLRHVHGGI